MTTALSLKSLSQVAIALFLFVHATAEGGLIVDFRFNEPAGTPLVSSGSGSVTDSVSSYVFTPNTTGDAADLQLVTTDGAGVLRPTAFTSGNLRDGRVTLSPADQVNASQNSPARIVVDFAPWSFGAFATGDEELVRFGFGNTSATNVFATVTLRRAMDNSVTLLGSSLVGVGVETSLFGNVQTEPVAVILDLDKAANSFSVSYQVGAGPVVPLPGNQNLALDPARNGNFLRLSFDEPFTGDTFGIERYRVFTNVPEPTSVALAGAAVGSILSRRRRAAV